MFDHIISSNSTMVGHVFENVDLEIPKNAMKPHEQFIFDHSIPSNSTMVGENFENVEYEIPKMQWNHMNSLFDKILIYCI